MQPLHGGPMKYENMPAGFCVTEVFPESFLPLLLTREALSAVSITGVLHRLQIFPEPQCPALLLLLIGLIEPSSLVMDFLVAQTVPEEALDPLKH